MTVNTGKGPAYNIKILQGVKVSRTFVFTWPESGSAPVQHTTDVLGPLASGSTVRVTIDKLTPFPKGISKSILDAVHKRQSYLYVYGTVEYDQRVFDPPQKQQYTYCYYFVPGPTETDIGSFAECPQQPSFPTLNERR